ncbi:hypothetical protein, partial [Luteibacter sp. 22Crub2.1]|uniref:hypothetical protein n=1 Tax=Luteibacter sp. 22Crub2.1 TaxID=1283288 RepID=UPI001C37E6BF
RTATEGGGTSGREKGASLSLLPAGTSVIEGIGFVLVIVGDSLFTERSSTERIDAVRAAFFSG